MDLSEAEIIEYAKKYWDEEDWPNVKQIQARIKPGVVLSLFDGDGKFLGLIQGDIESESKRTVQVAE